MSEILRDALGEFRDEVRAVPADALADRALTRYRRRRTVGIVATAAAVVVLLLGTAGLAAAVGFGPDRADVPVASDKGGRSATSVLVIGLYERTDGVRDADGWALVQIPEGRRSAYVLSMSKAMESRVDGRSDLLRNVYARGGAAAGVRAVEGITGIRPQHVVEVDVTAVTALVDSVGGVDVRVVDSPQRDPGAPHTIGPGEQHLTGQRVGDYLRERRGMPNGDFDTQRRHQVMMLALARKLVAAGPAELVEAARAVAPRLTVDRALDVPAFAASLSDLAPADIRFAVLPGGDTVAMPDGSAAIRPGRAAADLRSAVAAGTVAAWFDRYGGPAPVSGP